MGKLKTWAMEYEPDAATEQQFQAEWQAELEQQQSDADYERWLDMMYQPQECAQ